MGVLIPADLALSSLRNDSERLVVEAFRDRLTDGWVVLPSVELTGHRDYEIDVVLAHASDGVVVVEVKGHQPTIRDGVWFSGHQRMEPQPFDQARNNAYALRRELRGLHPSLAHLEIEYAVAFPNVDRVSGTLPSGVHETQVLTCGDLEDPLDAVERLVTRRAGVHLLGEVGLQCVITRLRPNCEFDLEHEARARLARARLDDICRQQVDALAGLDENRRVCVTGAAGTGKTRLAHTWAARARRRGERVLFTCFNIPLADTLRERFVLDLEIRVGAFHDIARTLDGMPSLAQPDDADTTWWNTVEMPHLLDHWAEVTERFDTIVVDEAQDFDPVWIDLLTRLLDPDGERRLLLVADEAQEVYARGFVPPAADDGWVRCRLASNCRNSFDIASVLHRRFDGAIAPVGGPETEDLRTVVADGLDAAVAAVGDAIDDLEERGHGAQRILVATFTGSVRDRLRDEYALVRWEEREPLAIVCENVHRVKGLEFDHVILVVHDESVSDELLYVGLSRAVMSAAVIGPSRATDRLLMA